MKTLVLHTKPAEKSGVVLENRQITEYMFERPRDTFLSGSIFLGQVQKIMKELGAAFIDFGSAKNGFLKESQIPWSTGKIEQAITEGQMLAVQVIKETSGEKGAQLTADITVPGLYLVYQPFGRTISISKNIQEPRRSDLKLAVEASRTGDEGVIIRTAAEKAVHEELLSELSMLKETWQTIDKKNNPILQDPMLPDQFIRKYPFTDIHEIIIDDIDVVQYVKRRYPALAERIRWDKKAEEQLPLSINELQARILQNEVPVAGGAQLIIEETEAMVVIDVNSSSHVKRAMANSQAFEVNAAAAEEAARQIKLRNLSGIIMIDFISMKSKKLEQKLIHYMKKHLAEDAVPATIYGMTKLGIMEISRKRQWMCPPKLLRANRKPKLNFPSVIFQMERELLAKSGNGSEAVLVAVHPDLLNEKKQLISEPFSSKISQDLFVREDASVSTYQIELEGSQELVNSAIKHRSYNVDNLF
ncbi:ribonuclease E/G [Halobacillus salinarum]|uniref:Ribonuclease E/G n=1 Tax=Halobacillus salinarum TaxID=2932257 RepID=A0ABY4EP68_9BACI|nr:ribonuclease E/G [Halobacillus salinarum]UOQ46255.1 ribonuclease E/G [Halobacillus salinarum]